MRKTLEDFFKQFSNYILSKNIDKIYLCFSEKKKIRTIEEFKKFYARSTVLSHITEIELKKEINNNCFSGKVKTDSGRNYPTRIKINKENDEWKVREIEFIP